MRSQIQKLLAGAAFLATISGLRAQPAETNTASPIRAEPPQPPATPPFEVSIAASYTAASEAKHLGVKSGDSAAFSTELGLRANAPLREGLRWTGGLRQENFFLDEIPGLPIPGQIHTLGFTTGLGYRIDEKWMINGSVGASLYRFEDISTDTFGVNGGVMALFKASQRWSWNFGFAVSPDSDIKVLPIIGFHWAIDDQLSLDVGVPRTRLSYRLQPGFEIFSGLGMAGATFRLANDFGAARYNNALATYRDVRFGFGVSAKFAQRFTAELEAGASLYRRLKYTRLDEDVRFSPGPYVRLGLNAHF